MPNWVENDITIKGHPRTLQRFVKALRTTDKDGEVNEFDFNAVLPCPEKLKGNDWQNNKEVSEANVKEYGYSGWYDWNVANWGTKWNSCDARLFSNDKDKHTLVYSFQTAWSPVGDKVMRLLSRRFPSLTFIHEFHEEAGMYPSERCTWQDGLKASEEIENNLTCSDEDEE